MTIERRQRRVIRSAPVTPSTVPTPTVAAPSASSPGIPADFAGYLQHLRDVVRTKQYRILGRLSRVQIVRPAGAKVLDFRKEGPVLGFQSGTEQLVVVTQWNGIPSRWDDTDEFCPDCLAKCDVCDGTGQKACEAYQCGGSGKVPQPMVPCSAPGCVAEKGSIKAGCAVCRGTGNEIRMADCKVCAGTGKASCSSCRGTGKRPTGIEGGSYDRKKPACERCRGSRFAHKEIPQPIADFLDTRIGPMISLGPITRFAVESVGGEGSPPQVFDVEADSSGRHLVILLEGEQPGSAVFMIGGVLNAVTRVA